MSSNVESGIVSTEHTNSSGQTFTVQSTGATSEANLKENIGAGQKPEKTDDKPDISKAASELGKKGGEAAAKARAKAQREARKAEKEQEDGVQGAEGVSDAGDVESGESSPDPERTPEQNRKDRRGDPRHDPTARVAEATRAASEARKELERERRERAELARRLEEIERRTATPEEKAQREREVAEPEPPGRPKAEDYDDYEKYLFDAIKWDREVAESKRQAQERVRYRTEALRRVESDFSSKVGESLKADPSYRDRIHESFWEIRPSYDEIFDPKSPSYEGRPPTAINGMADYFLKYPDSALGIMEYLSDPEHEETLQRIATLRTPSELARELAKIEHSLEAAPQATSTREVEVSRAKPPIKPVSGGSAVTEANEYKPGMSLTEYSRIWKKLKAQGRR